MRETKYKEANTDFIEAFKNFDEGGAKKVSNLLLTLLPPFSEAIIPHIYIYIYNIYNIDFFSCVVICCVRKRRRA